MKIVVIGGSGLIGTKLVNRLRQLGHNTIAAAPNSGVNTLTGEGLTEVLQDADTIVDVSNAPSSEDQAALDFFQKSTRNLLDAAIYAPVKHYIALSVVGADRLPDSGYMRAKVNQEELIKTSHIPYTILRSTPFFELAGRIASAGTIAHQVHISPAAIQPVAADEVVTALIDIVLDAPLNAIVEIAGPVCMPLYELIRYYLNETEDSRQLVEDQYALYFGAELHDDSLIPAVNARLGEIKYEDWFQAQLAAQ